MARLTTTLDHPRSDQPPILDAAQQWKQKCLLSDGSVLSDSLLWTESNLGILEEQFSKNPIEGDQSFLDKFRQQLEPTPALVKQLAAEIIWLLLLFPSNIGGAKKRQNITEVWSWSGADLSGSHPMLALLDNGIGSAGQAFNQRRDLELTFAIRIGRNWKRTKESKSTLIEDPWSLGNWIDRLPDASNRGFRHMILFLLFPDFYERTATARHKASIASTFSAVVPDSLARDGDSPGIALDKKLLAIRKHLEGQHPGEEIDFYRSPIQEMWRKPNTLDEEDAETAVSKGVTRLRNWIFQASPQLYDLQGALKELKEQTWLTSQYRTDIHTGDRAFLWEAGSDAGILGVATVSSEPAEIPHPDSEKQFMKDQSKFSGLQPRVHLRIDKVLQSRLRKIDLLKDPILSKLRVIANPRGTNYPLSTEEAQKLNSLVGITQAEPIAVPAAGTDRFRDLVQKTFLPAAFFQDLETLLITKQQIILQGAPGTGKTFVAKEVAKWWAGNPDRSANSPIS